MKENLILQPRIELSKYKMNNQSDDICLESIDQINKGIKQI